MSVLVKGMEIPNNCGTCPLRLAWCRERLYMVTRPPRCPLIELPHHGDLIDRDALMAHTESAYDIDGYELYAVGTGTILMMPVVIPAERSEDVSKSD